jgi:lipopolysaccharide biosynthesis protein
MIKPIAIYLPQFHAIPENDKAWGKGFTEWTNVKKAKPLFDGHYQPHIPHEDVGYYDLTDPEVLVRQAAMAKEFGIHGFAYYHYWFNGKRLLETPLDNMLKTGTPDFPFLYIWANENWSKRWDGHDNEIIIKQDHSIEDDLNHIQFLCKNVFSDKRYITIDGKPVFMVYRTELLPNINETARIWRNEAKKHGFKDLYLVRVDNLVKNINPLEIGFDAVLEFAPDWNSVDISKSKSDYLSNYVNDYSSTVLNMLMKNDCEYPWFRCVFPGWDNSARKSFNAIIYKNNSSEIFRHFVYRTAEYTKKHFNEDSQFLFINAWNEWGEGCHIEPDEENGYTFLQSIKDGLNNMSEEYLTDYIEFLENYIKLSKNDHEELESLKLFYNKMTYSKGHKLMESFLKIVRKFKRFLSSLNIRLSIFGRSKI